MLKNFKTSLKKPVSWTTVLISGALAFAATNLVAWAAAGHYIGDVVITDPTTPTQRAAVSASGELKVNCTSGCSAGSGSQSNATSAVATSADNGKTVAWAYGFNGTSWDQLQVDGSKFLKVNCASGCAGGTFNNNADDVATSSTNGQSAAWLYVWDGAAWDRLYGNATDGALVNLGANNDVVLADTTASGNITTQNLVPAGTATAGSAVAISTHGIGTVTIQVTGTYTGALSPQVTTDGSVWITQAASTALLNMSNGTTSATISSGSTGIWQIEVNGHDQFRITGLAAMTGTAVVTLRGAAGSGQTTISGSAQVTGTGTAGSAAAGVISVQGIASMTPVQVGGTAVDDAAASGNPVPVGGKYNTTRPTYADGDRTQTQYDARGNQTVALYANAAANQFESSAVDAVTNTISAYRFYQNGYIFNGTDWDRVRGAVNSTNSVGTGIAAAAGLGQCDDTTPTALTENSFGNARIDCTDHTQIVGGLVTTGAPTYTTGTARGASYTTLGSQRVDIGSVVGTATAVNNGTASAGVQRVVLASDQTSNTNPFLVNGAVTPADALALGTTSVSTVARMGVYNGTTTDLAREFVAAADSTGTGIQANAMYGQFDDASIATVTENRVAPIRMNSDRAQLVQPVPSASQVNALSVSSVTAFANSENETEAKATAGAVYGFSVSNNTATIAYLTFYNTAAAGTTCGTNELYNFIIPASTSGAGNNVTLPFPIPFSTAISYCITTGIGGTGSVAANSGTAVIFYK